MNSDNWHGFRLSRQQERTLALARDGHAARVIAAARIAGTIDRKLLAQAAGDVIAAHESLRTAYRQVLGGRSAMLMVIDEPAGARIEELPATACAAGSLQEAIDAFMAAEPPGDADAVAATRLALLAHADGSHTLLLSTSRLNLDGLSVDVFFRDLQQAFAARAAGREWHREEIVQYADFAQWQIEQAQGEGAGGRETARQLELADIAPPSLPLELNSQDRRAANCRWQVPVELASALRSVAAQERVSLRATLLAGWLAALWHAAARPERIAVEVTTTARPFDDLAWSIGSFETSAPVFAELSGQTSFRDLMRALEAELLTIDRDGESPVPGTTAPTPGWRRVPGFQFLEHTPFEAGAVLRIARVASHVPGEPNKAALAAEVAEDELSIELRHQAAGFADGGAEALMTCVQAVLRALGANPAQSIADPAMLDDSAAAALIAQTNPAASPPKAVRCWHARVEDVARRTPDAPAMRCNSHRWTCRELDLFANRIANELRARGVGPGTLVGMYLERSDLAIASMLGIAKAGAAYVPVDPSLPAQRQAVIFAEASLRHAVTGAQDIGLLPAGVDGLVIDRELSACAARATGPTSVEPAPESPAYVLFTSGSTGVPKGVVVSHAQLAAYIDGALERLELDGPVSAVSLNSLATDLGHTALFLALTSGGELDVIGAGISMDSQAMATHLSANPSDLMKITPSHLAAILAVADAPEKVLPRRRLVLGGEAFSWGWFNLFRTFAGECRIYNHYGPTESTVGVLCGQMLSNAAAGLASTVPLGTPLANARTYILDPEQRPLPAGVTGELWIGGQTVATGYLARREGQAERFLRDPWSAVPNGRMYRSGDRVRLLPDGAIEFLGRIDRQVKVRGFRVELGEIEAAMRQHQRVSAALAIEAGESSGTHIVGYIVDAQGTRGKADWLRPFLAERLPDFMMPAHLVALDRFPLTAAGKVDASMLPDPASVGEGAQADLVEPRTPTEVAVAGIIADLLLLKQVGANQDFFDIGGHSLLATQLLTKLRKTFDVDVRLRSLFEHSIVSELAELIDARVAAKAGVA